MGTIFIWDCRILQELRQDFFHIWFLPEKKVHHAAIHIPSYHILASLHDLHTDSLVERNESRHHGHDKRRHHHHTENVLDRKQKPLQKQIREKQCPGRFQKSPKTGANVSFFIKLKIYIFA